jgi:undecaprenyl-diphosphatase
VITTVSVAGFVWLAGERRLAMFLVVSVAAGIVLAMASKNVFHRPRPLIVPHLSSTRSSSFPSGHSMISAIVYLTLGSLLMRIVPTWRLKAYILLVAIGLSGLVGASRVLLGVHYPSDVLAGWTIGVIWSEASWLVWRLWNRSPTATSTKSAATTN